MVQRNAPEVFSAALRRRRLERAAVNFRDHAFVHEHVADDIVDRLETTLRRFEHSLFLGPGAPILRERLTEACGVGNVTIASESSAFLSAQGVADGLQVDADRLPFQDAQFELVVSVMSLHAENRLPEALIEARRVLKPDGLFIASFPAGRTLSNLRQALRDAEVAATGGVSPRVAPMVAIKDGGALLQRAGFALPVADTQPIRVRYKEPLRLFRDLRGMGETSSLAKGAKGALRRDVLRHTLSALSELDVLFDILVITGWAPHPSQQQPSKPGSGKVSMAEAVKANLQSAPQRATPINP